VLSSVVSGAGQGLNCLRKIGEGFVLPGSNAATGDRNGLDFFRKLKGGARKYRIREGYMAKEGTLPIPGDENKPARELPAAVHTHIF